MKHRLSLISILISASCRSNVSISKLELGLHPSEGNNIADLTEPKSKGLMGAKSITPFKNRNRI